MTLLRVAQSVHAILKLEIVSIKTTVGGHSPLKPLTVWDELLGRSAERSK